MYQNERTKEIAAKATNLYNSQKQTAPDERKDTINIDCKFIFLNSQGESERERDNFEGTRGISELNKRSRLQ